MSIASEWGAEVAVDAAGELVAEAWALGESIGSALSDACPIFRGPDADAAGAAFFGGLRRATLRAARELGEDYGFAGRSPLSLYRQVSVGRFREQAIRAAFSGWIEGDRQRATLESAGFGR